MSETGSGDDPTFSDSPVLLAAIEQATAGYRHAETIVQARLYNFLVAATILLASWSGFAASDSWCAFFRFLVAALGLFLSVVWAILGSREQKFLTLNMDGIVSLEDKLSDGAKAVGAMTTVPIAKLQRGQVVQLCMEDRTIKLNSAEWRLSSRRLLVLAPIAFAVAFAALLLRSLWGLFPS